MLRCFAAGGALHEGQLLKNRGPPPLGPDVQALVIDDLVCVSVVPKGQEGHDCPAGQLHARSQEIYKQQRVEGSPDKDVIASDHFQAIGAELNSGPAAVAAGCLPLGAPLSRRVPLALLSLRAAALPITSSKLCARLGGAWISVALFRRPLMVLFSEIFKEARGCDSGTTEQVAQRQSRSLSQELCLASALVPLFASDLTARTLPKAFATDASLGRGAICEAELPYDVARSLWLNSDRRGAYSKLVTGASADLAALGVPTLTEDEDPSEAPMPAQIPFKLDLILVGRPSAHLLDAASRVGLRVGPAISYGASAHFDIFNPAFAVWLDSVLKARLVLSVVLLPPRAKVQGHRSSEAKARREQLANRVFARLLVFLHLARQCEACALILFEPGLCKRHLGPSERARLASLSTCQFGDPRARCHHLMLLASRLNVRPLVRQCLCEGGLLKTPLPYNTPPDPLPWGLALEVSRGVVRSIEASSEGRVARGLESPVLNDILDTASWSVVQVFPWHGRAHINVLELAVIGVLERRLALEAPDSRFITLADSCVAKAAAAKGRSTSVALTPGLRRACSLQIAYGLYPGYGFAPTRLNIADDPTRLVDLRRAAGFPLHRHLSVPALHNLGRLRLRRSLASWVRLCLAILLSRESCHC